MLRKKQQQNTPNAQLTNSSAKKDENAPKSLLAHYLKTHGYDVE